MGWWISYAERTLTEDVPATPAEVRDFYVDLDNLKLVHPLVVSVRARSHSETADGYVRRYRVSDRIPVWFFSIAISYRAQLRVPDAGDVITTAHQFPQVRLDATVSFAAIDAGTRVVERLRIAAPRPLAAVTTRQAVNAHIAMLAGIRRRFQSEPRT
ncbi:MAG: SRPBCC family protein [Mycobacterium sp.]|nr:SRPBCC family protein [Mycobacterium sp.]